MSDFWIKTTESGQQQGPFAARQVKQLATTGQLKPDHLVSSDNCATWISAGKFANLEFGALVLEPEVGPEVSPPPGRPLRSRPAATTAGAKISHERREDGESRARKKSRRALIATTCCVVGVAVVGIAIVGFSGTGPGVSGMHPGGDGGQFRLTDVAGGIDTMPPPVADSSEPTASAAAEAFTDELLSMARNPTPEQRRKFRDKYGTKKSIEELPSDAESIDYSKNLLSSASQEITFKELELRGDTYEGKCVKLTNCKFRGVHKQEENPFPTLRIQRDAEMTSVDSDATNMWLYTEFEDSAGNYNQYPSMTFALKDHWIDTFINMEYGQNLSIAGVVTKRKRSPEEYSLVLTDIDTGGAAKQVDSGKHAVVLIPEAAKAIGSDAVPFAIKKDEFLARLRKHLLSRQEEEVVRLLGKPVEVEKGSFYYDCHVRDELTGTVYRHIRVRLSMSGLCVLVSLGQSRLVR